METEINPRIFEVVKNEEPEDIADIIQKACELEGALYRDDHGASEEVRVCLFNLRKSLEGVFGHDIPNNGYDEED